MNNVSAVNQKKNIAPFITFSVALIVVFGIWKGTYKGVPTHPRKPPQDKIIGTMAPDFTLPDLQGVKQTLSAYKGKVVFLNIWATWCKPCADEMPSMQKLYEKFKGSKFEIIAASIDYEPELVQPFMKKHGLTFKALLDPLGETSKLYETTGVPETFIIDKQGKVVEKIVGPMDWDTDGVFTFFEDLINSPG